MPPLCYCEFHYQTYILGISRWPAVPVPGITLRFGPTTYTLDDVLCPDPCPHPGADVPFVCTCVPSTGIGGLSAVLAGDPNPDHWPDLRVLVGAGVLWSGDMGRATAGLVREYGTGAGALAVSEAVLWLERARVIMRVIRVTDQAPVWVMHPDLRVEVRARVIGRAEALGRAGSDPRTGQYDRVGVAG